MTTPPKRTVADLQRVTHLGENLIRAAIRTGELPGYFVGDRRIVIPEEAFQRFLRGEWQPQPRPVFAAPVKPIVTIRRRRQESA